MTHPLRHDARPALEYRPTAGGDRAFPALATQYFGDRAEKSSPTDEVLFERLALLVDDQCGVLSRIEKFIFPSGYDGQMHGFTAALGRISALHPLPIKVGDAIGEFAGYCTALDATSAAIRAVCEGLERYCALMYPTVGVLVSTARELGDEALAPSRLPQCSARERARAAPEHRLRLPNPDFSERWIRGYSLTRRKLIWVPLSAVYLTLPEPLTNHLAFPQSTGFAAGVNYNQAVLAGLCEVIERDSMVLWWLHKLPMPRIAIEGATDPRMEELLERARVAGIATDLFDLTTDVGVPVVGLIQRTELGRPHNIAMAACRTDGIAATIRVLEEACSVRVALRSRDLRVNRDAVLSGEPHSPESFGMLYAEKSASRHFAFALQHRNVRSTFPAPVRSVDALFVIIKRLQELGMEVITVDVTLPELRDFGILVVRVIVPELMPLSFSHQIRFLAHSRLYSAPEALGYGPRTEDMITNEPIPFA